jgi:hypothetical protein
MKHSSIRELFEYWNERRGLRAAPERAEIEPSAIRRVLADTFILAFDPRAGHPFRVAGTRVCALFGRELKGEAFLDLWSRAARRDLRELVNIVAHEAVGVIASAAGQGAADTAALNLELLLLPLGAQGRTDARVLGALAPSEPPAWLGTRALHDLALGTRRYLGPAVSPASRAWPAVPVDARIRHGFIVYDGGQT